MTKVLHQLVKVQKLLSFNGKVLKGGGCACDTSCSNWKSIGSGVSKGDQGGIGPPDNKSYGPKKKKAEKEKKLAPSGNQSRDFSSILNGVDPLDPAHAPVYWSHTVAVAETVTISSEKEKSTKCITNGVTCDMSRGCRRKGSDPPRKRKQLLATETRVAMSTAGSSSTSPNEPPVATYSRGHLIYPQPKWASDPVDIIEQLT